MGAFLKGGGRDGLAQRLVEHHLEGLEGELVHVVHLGQLVDLEEQQTAALCDLTEK